VHNEAKTIVFRDDVSPGGLHLDSFSPHTFIDDLRAADIPIYSYSGWFDGGYPHAAIKRFLTLRNRGAKLILGPGSRRRRSHASVRQTDQSAFRTIWPSDRTFFDRYLKGVDTGRRPRTAVAYYTMVADRWRQARPAAAEARYETFYRGEKSRAGAYGAHRREPGPTNTASIRPPHATGRAEQPRAGRAVYYPTAPGTTANLLV
jgi:putative CocE/NonD family hydrolase